MREEPAGEKAALRRRMLAERQALPADGRQRWSAAICRRVGGTPLFREAAHVVAYLPLGAEVDPTDAASHVLRSGRALYYPCDDGTVGIRRAYDVAGRSAASSADDQALSSGEHERLVFLVPGVAFDAAGARLGRGGGWYDRLLTRFERAGRIGLAFDAQIVSRVPVDPWDARMDAVATESRCLVSDRSPALPERRA
jgi:5-formyltetrahydrofolate cyclo-ligase